MADSLAAATQQVADLVDSLKLEDPPKDSNGTESSTDASALESKPATEGSVTKESKTQLDAKDPRPFYPSNPYYGYYYPGHETAGKEWEDQTRFAGADGVDVQYPSAPASENGSVVYYPSYGYGQNPYNPYNPYIPGAMIGTEGQYMGQRPYYTGQFQQPPASAGYFQPLPVHPPRPETGHMPPGKANGNAGGKGANKAGLKDAPKGMQPGASLPRNFRPMSQIQLNQQQGPANGVTFQAKDTMHFRKFNPGFNQGKMLMPYGNMNGMAYKHNIRPRGKFFGYHGNENWNFDGLNEQNRGPRTNRPKGYQNPSDVRNSGSQGAAANGEVQTDKSQYNLESFSVDYDAAKFFVIKSYSEDDVHQSIKYNVWASTPNGNKRLDGAYQEAQKLSTESNKECPVFLFFSVNASGQFCGVAEMIGSVDFEKSMDFWQQDKWNGFFPVKWHMIKDIPNSQFRQIILENNDNKPVTNSRDTQEIKFQQGVEMLKIFKNYMLKTSILDDFMFYEGRQKQMKEKKLRQQALQQQKAVAKENGFKNHDDKSSGLKVPSVAANGHQLPDSISLINGDSAVSGETKDSSQGSDVTKTGSEELQVENPNVLMGFVARMT